jgi:hypothetical protein
MSIYEYVLARTKLLDEVHHYAPADLEQKYLVSSDGAKFGRINGTHCIVIAETVH